MTDNGQANVSVRFRVLFTVTKYSKVRGIREAGELHREIYNHCWPSTIDETANACATRLCDKA